MGPCLIFADIRKYQTGPPRGTKRVHLPIKGHPLDIFIARVTVYTDRISFYNPEQAACED